MKIAIHQSHYLPWLRYWAKVACSDVFVLLDDVQFTKNDWQNRNKIKSPSGVTVLTVPVYQRLGQKIAETSIDNKQRWAYKHLQSLILCYGKAECSADYLPALEKIYKRSWDRLVDINDELFRYLKEALGIRTEIVRGSEIKAEGEGTARLVNICRSLGGDIYLTGKYAARTYLDGELFSRAGIDIEEQEWECPVYKQLFMKQGFIPELSVVDLLFNCGERSLKILTGDNG